MLRSVLMCSQARKDPAAQEGSCLLEQEAERRASEGLKCSQEQQGCWKNVQETLRLDATPLHRTLECKVIF